MGRRKTKGKNRGMADKDDDNSTVVSLTANVLGEVLSRLDPPELFKLKCVSKTFRNFIGKPEFVAHYYRNGRATAGIGLTGLFFQQPEPEKRRWSLYGPQYRHFGCKLDVVRFDLVVAEASKLPDPTLKLLRQGTGDIEIIDSCNGLLFCSFNKNKVNKGKLKFHRLFVCNPLTTEKVVIPPPGKQSRGVGFALAADLDNDYLKYKVLCLRTKKDDKNSQLSMFCSETGEWTEVCDNLPPVTSKFEYTSSRVFFKGSLYWDCFKGHTLAFHLNPAKERPCYELIEAPRAVFGRSLWKSEDKLHCCCHGVEQQVAQWKLGFDRDRPEWKNEFGDGYRLRNLADDLINGRYRIISPEDAIKFKFKIITYDPQSDTLFFLLPSQIVCSYQCSKRSVHAISSLDRDYGKALAIEERVLAYTHSLVHIQMADKVRGRRYRRTPRCQGFSIED